MGCLAYRTKGKDTGNPPPLRPPFRYCLNAFLHPNDGPLVRRKFLRHEIYDRVRTTSRTTRYTYLLKNIRDHQAVWENMSPNIRRNIAKAQNKYHISVKKGIPLNEFLAVQAQTFDRQHVRIKEDTNVLKDLIATCRQRGQGDLWGGYDEQGHLHAAAFIVWQDRSAYYLAGGGNPAYRGSGAQSYVLWECLHFVSQFTTVFDFEGSMLPRVERFFREFGAIQTPFFTISRGKLSLLDRARIKLSKWV